MSSYKFKPFNVGRWIIWSLFAIVLIFAPLVFTSNLSGTMLAQMGIAIIACLGRAACSVLVMPFIRV